MEACGNEVLMARYGRCLKAVAEYSRLLWERGLVDGNGGNISVRVDTDVFIVTPTMFSKREVTERTLCFVNASGTAIHGLMEKFGQCADIRPTSEFVSHLAVYSTSPEIRAVVHTHPPYTCSYACTCSFPSRVLTPEGAIWAGNPVMVPYRLPGSRELAECIEKAAYGRNAVVLQNHGLMTWGRNLKEAFWRTEVIEANCRLMHLVESRGDVPREFTAEESEELESLRSRFSVK